MVAHSFYGSDGWQLLSRTYDAIMDFEELAFSTPCSLPFAAEQR